MSEAKSELTEIQYKVMSAIPFEGAKMKEIRKNSGVGFEETNTAFQSLILTKRVYSRDYRWFISANGRLLMARYESKTDGEQQGLFQEGEK